MQRIELSGKSRKDMDEWITAIKAVASSEYYEGSNFHLDVQEKELSQLKHKFTFKHFTLEYINKMN